MTNADARTDEIVIRETYGRLHVVNTNASQKAVRVLEEGEHCAVIGARYCEKTLLLGDIHRIMEERGRHICVAVDFREVPGAGSMRSVVDIAVPILGEFASVTRQQANVEISEKDEAQFQRCIQSLLDAADRNVVLLLNGLEQLPTAIVRAFLRTLRALSMTWQVDATKRLSVITASSFRLYDLALGPTSPFNIAKSIVVRDLSQAESEAFIDVLAEHLGLKLSEDARRRLLDATRGDRNWIRELCESLGGTAGEISEVILNETIEQRIDPDNLPPAIRAAIRALESDASLLISGLEVLRRGAVPRSELRLGLSSEIDPFELTGAFRQITRNNVPHFVVRNEVYERVLERHFTPDKVIRALRTLGAWTDAFEYLADLSHDDADALNRDLLVASIYAARDEADAHAALAKRLCHVLSAKTAAVYLLDSKRDLKRVSVWPQRTDLPEYVSGEHDMEPIKHLGHHFPLPGPNQEPIGVVWVDGLRQPPGHDEFIAAQDYLGNVARALDSLRSREVQMADAYRHYTDTRYQFEKHDDLLGAGEPSLEAILRTFPNGDAAYIFEWDDAKQLLFITANKGATPAAAVSEITLKKEEGYVGWAFSNRQPVLIADAERDRRTKFFEHHGLVRERSAICAPMELWGKMIGALVVVNTEKTGAFRSDQLELLSSFALALGTRVHLARANRELYECGLHINQRDSVETIFRITIDAIQRVTAVSAANLWMLHAGKAVPLRISDEPRLKLSVNLDAEFERDYKPRLNGLTYRAVERREPVTSSVDELDVGMNQFFTTRSIRASLALPLTAQGDVRGVLLLHYHEPHTFFTNEIKAVSLFANQLALALENAEQRREMKIKESVFLMGLEFSNLAHSLKQHVGALRNVTHHLRRLVGDRAEIAPIIDDLDRYTSLVNRVPDRSVIFETRPLTMINLHQYVEDFFRTWAESEERKEIGTTVRIEATPTTVYADHQGLQTVLETLARNSRSAMSKSDTKEVEVTIQRKGARVVVHWRDTGTGIDDEIKGLLFEAPVSHGPGAQNLGVGLLLAQRVIRRYHGDIQLRETSPAGTTFTFWLPHALPLPENPADGGVDS